MNEGVDAPVEMILRCVVGVSGQRMPKVMLGVVEIDGQRIHSSTEICHIQPGSMIRADGSVTWVVKRHMHLIRREHRGEPGPPAPHHRRTNPPESV